MRVGNKKSVSLKVDVSFCGKIITDSIVVSEGLVVGTGGKDVVVVVIVCEVTAVVDVVVEVVVVGAGTFMRVGNTKSESLNVDVSFLGVVVSEGIIVA